MKRLTKTILSSFAILASATTLQADDKKHFQGFYVGGDLGIAESDFYYGGHLGARAQTDNNWVFGAEGTFGSSNSSASVRINRATVTGNVDHNWSIGGYVGKAFGDDARNLIKIGAAHNNLQVKVSANNRSVTVDIKKLRGFIGYERALAKNLSFRLQGDYMKAFGQDITQFTTGLSLRF